MEASGHERRGAVPTDRVGELVAEFAERRLQPDFEKLPEVPGDSTVVVSEDRDRLGGTVDVQPTIEEVPDEA